MRGTGLEPAPVGPPCLGPVVGNARREEYPWDSPDSESSGRGSGRGPRPRRWWTWQRKTPTTTWTSPSRLTRSAATQSVRATSERFRSVPLAHWVGIRQHGLYSPTVERRTEHH